jgi:uncharacterized protein (TIGR02391 family)
VAPLAHAISATRTILENARPQLEESAAELLATAEPLERACHTVGESWSGSFAGYHGFLYFRDFQRPATHQRFSVEWGGIQGLPDGWRERTPEEVKGRIEQIAGGLSIDVLERRIAGSRRALDDVRRELLIAFATVTFDERFRSEASFLKELETLKLGDTSAELLHARMPGTLITRDSQALMQGIAVPSHLYYEAGAQEALSLADAIDTFLKLADRLVRQLEAKTATSTATIAKELDALHSEIFRKCSSLYKAGAYAEAVEKGFKVVRDRLRHLTGFETGSEAFGKGGLYINGAVAPNVDKDFNDGVKFLTMAIDKFRNEKSHSSDAKIDDPTRAYEYLSLSSLAMNLLNQAEIRKP